MTPGSIVLIVLGSLFALIWLYIAARVVSRAVLRSLHERKDQ